MTETATDYFASTVLDPAGIDRSLPFFPPGLCPFAFLAEAAHLPPKILLRQNQLHALYVLEMIQAFETWGRRALAPLVDEFACTRLGVLVADFIGEEQRHSTLFAALNRAAAPELYASSDRYFIRPPRWAGFVTRVLTSSPRRFAFWPWLMLIQEEKALHLSRAYVRETVMLEPHFLEAHRRHAADEAHHVRWDEQLIERLWPEASPLRRRWNARLLTWLMREFFHAPKRGGMRLLARLVQEFPEYELELSALRGPMLALANNPAWHRTNYSREMMPRALALMSRWREFRPLAAFLVGGFAPP